MKQKATRLSLGVAALVLCRLVWSAAVLPRATSMEAQSDWRIVRIAYRDRADLERLAARLDVWEVRVEDGFITARVNPADYDWLLSQGYIVEEDRSRSRQFTALPGYDCYRTVSQLYADVDALASTYPSLTRIITIGTSYESRPLRVLVLTNKEHVISDKPRFFLLANIHGREFITPEAALQFARLLLEGYGREADATWLLDWQEIHVLVTANPDGHFRNEQVFVYWRKNANPENQNQCPNNYGTDLNRNSSFQWGGVGASSYPCDETYRGQSAASERETQAIQDYAVALFPDQRGPLITDTAPLTSTGVLVTLHSYGSLVLWPWGFTSEPAPNSAQLARLGQKLAGLNGYVPQPAYALYPTSGTTDDWSYGELGIASYTFEMGGYSDGFLPPCSRYDAIIQSNLSALLYAARVARAPYQLSAGPDVISPTIAFDAVGRTAHLTATVASNQIISAAQAYLDTPPWAGGEPLMLSAADGMFDQASEFVTASLPMFGLSERHIVFVRGQDVAGEWGPVFAVFLSIPRLYYFPLVMRY